MGALISSIVQATTMPSASNPEIPLQQIQADADFARNENSYFGPNFIVLPKSRVRESEQQQSHYLDPSNTLWADIWSTMASGKVISKQDLKELGNPYLQPLNNNQTTPTTSILQALVNIKKNTIKLTRVGGEVAGNTLGYSLQFRFDSSTTCLVQVFCNVKEVVVVDSQTGSPTGMKNIIFRSSDSSVPKLYTFGPFGAGLNQKFVVPQDFLFQASDFYGNTVDEAADLVYDDTVVNSNDPADISAGNDTHEVPHNPSSTPRRENEGFDHHQSIEASKQIKHAPALFNMVIVLETVVPSLAKGLEKASAQGLPNPVNSQLTYMTTISSVNSPGCFETKIQKQRIIIDSESYLLQEVYGFRDDDEERDNDPYSEATDGQPSGSGGAELSSSTRDCVICMSDVRDTIVLPCRHLCLCNECALVLRGQDYRVNIPPPITPATTTIDPAEHDIETGGHPPTAPTAASRFNLFTPAASTTVVPNERSMLTTGPPKCPICRQVFHSLLQINLPNINAGALADIDSST